MEMKMLVVCECGVRLNVRMSQYLQMRCPKCHRMLAQEIERQAARNSKAMWEICAYMANERMTARRWFINDEVICRLLAKHEILSHGGQWPPPAPPKEEIVDIRMMEEPHEQSPLRNGGPLPAPEPEPEPPSPPVVVQQPVAPPSKPKSMKIKVRKVKKVKKTRR